MPSCTFNSSGYCICFSLTLKHMRLQAAHQYAKPFGTIMCIVCCIFRGSMHIFICVYMYRYICTLVSEINIGRELSKRAVIKFCLNYTILFINSLSECYSL
uniref:Uncharacterized protein n=1 Tax=Rhipicephalus microplus TaxID=6941 RepID=A0A6G5A1V4_RHIMP